MSRCHFTEDGAYLNIALLEYLPNTDVSNSNLHLRAPSHVNLLVYAYRLCGGKPTTALPHWLRTSAFRLDGLEQVKLSGTPSFPCTFTWTSDSLYITWSSTALTVHRVPLVHCEDYSDPDVAPPLRPQNTIPLPASAQHREVYFFPPESGDNHRIVVGGQHSTMERNSDVEPLARPSDAVPVGCVLQADHLGKWVPMPDSARNCRVRGELIVPLESFNPDVDCAGGECSWPLVRIL